MKEKAVAYYVIEDEVIKEKAVAYNIIEDKKKKGVDNVNHVKTC